MSDAWNAPGWTAQQSATYDTEDGVSEGYGIPDDVDLVRVHGEYRDISGGRARGYVLFEGSTAVTHVATGAVLQQPHFYARIHADGKFAIAVPASDSPALSDPLLYTISVVLGRKLLKSLPNVSLPAATPDVDLPALIAAYGS